MILSGRSRLAGVVGWPVAHSRSPRLHGYWLDHYGIDGAYVPLPVQPAALAEAIIGLKASGFRGVNITVPHKEAVLELCTERDRTAGRIGAANTLLFEDNAIIASNTDAFGFAANLEEAIPGWRTRVGKAVVLGAGGAARAIVAALADAGIADVCICNRTRSRARDLAASFGDGPAVVPWEDRERAIDECDLLVNSTSLGMQGQPPLDVSLPRTGKRLIVNDLVYSPLETPLLESARKQGHHAVDGLGMLLHQARAGFAAWFGKDPEVTPELRRVVLADT